MAATTAFGLLASAAVVYLGACALVALYCSGKGYPFFPLFVASTFLGFPVVLLVVVIAAGPKNNRS